MLALLFLLSVLVSCGEDDESCSEFDNAVIGGVCLQGHIADYDIVGEWSDEGLLTGVVSELIVIEFRGAGPTYKLFINGATQHFDETTQEWSDEYGLLETGKTYTTEANRSTGLLENDFGGGSTSATLTKVDRENKLISGFFRTVVNRQAPETLEWLEVIIEGTFDDVPAERLESII